METRIPNTENQIVNGFGSAQCVMLQGNPDEPIALALIVDLKNEQDKVISGIHYSVARNPFFSTSDIVDPAGDLLLFARVTIFRNLQAPLTALFDPFYDTTYDNFGVDTDPLATAYYKSRANYASEDRIFDLIIPTTCSKHHQFSELRFGKQDRITAVLTPVYPPFAGSFNSTRRFGDYYDGRIARTLGLHGCFGA